MKTAKKVHNGVGGWCAYVTTDKGERLLVEARFDGTAQVTAEDPAGGFVRIWGGVASRDDSAQGLARRALRFWRGEG